MGESLLPHPSSSLSSLFLAFSPTSHRLHFCSLFTVLIFSCNSWLFSCPSKYDTHIHVLEEWGEQISIILYRTTFSCGSYSLPSQERRKREESECERERERKREKIGTQKVLDKKVREERGRRNLPKIWCRWRPFPSWNWLLQTRTLFIFSLSLSLIFSPSLSLSVPCSFLLEPSHQGRPGVFSIETKIQLLESSSPRGFHWWADDGHVFL